ncbi:MAG: GNAT family N-acetyltransferase, partial [Alphaproteobacteria bacterium]|nr:GNAT family N-acetyltransferase [Alphaproteobacteria bacterium]
MIKIDDVTDPRVIQLLETHMATMEKASPPGTCHYLDLDGLRSADVTFYSVWESENVVAVGAVKKLDNTHGEIKSMHTSLNQRGKGTAS